MLLKEDTDDVLNLLIGRRVFEEVVKKISQLPSRKKDELLAAWVLDQMKLPDDLKDAVKSIKSNILKDVINTKKYESPEIPKRIGDIGVKVVKVETEEKEEEASKKETKKETKKVEGVKLSDLL